jgi:hypothetical protein
MTERSTPQRKLGICLCLVAVFLAPCCFAGDAAGDEQNQMSGGFQYSDDWKIVSAPPPPGPYSTVNVDPRVPGQDITRPVPRDLMLNEPSDGIPDELVQVSPPGAGIPARSAESQPLGSRPAYSPPPPAGAYGGQVPDRYPGRGYSGPGYPDYTYRQTYPGYGQHYGPAYNRGYGYSYPRHYAPYGQQDIPPPSYAVTPGR